MAISEQEIEGNVGKINKAVEDLDVAIKKVLANFDTYQKLNSCESMGLAKEVIDQMTEQAKAEVKAVIPDDRGVWKKRIFDGLYSVCDIVYQDILVNPADDSILKYGSVYVYGPSLLTAGCWGQVESLNSVYWCQERKVMIPYGVEIVEVVGNGLGFWAIPKDRTSFYYWGRGWAQRSSDSYAKYFGNPIKYVLPNNDKIKKIAVGKVTCVVDSTDYKSQENNAIYLTESGKLYGQGANQNYQLGLGHTNAVNEPAQLQIPDGYEAKDVSFASTGLYGFGIAIVQHPQTQKKALLCWGSNKDGNLGLGTNSESMVRTPKIHNPTMPPEKIWCFAARTDNSFASDASACFNSFCSMKMNTGDTQLYGCGNNNAHQIKSASDSKSEHWYLVQKKDGQAITNIVEWQGIAHKASGFFCGYDTTGQLWLGGTVKISMGKKLKNGGSGDYVKFEDNWLIEKMYYFCDWSLATRSSDFRDKPTLVFKTKQGKWYITGYDPRLEKDIEDIPQYKELENYDDLDPKWGMAFYSDIFTVSSNGTTSKSSEACMGIYGIEKAGQFVLARGRGSTETTAGKPKPLHWTTTGFSPIVESYSVH